MTLDLSLFNIKEKIRKIEIDGAVIGGDSSFSFMSENENTSSALIALEIPYFEDSFYPQIVDNSYESKDFFHKLEAASQTQADIISIKFNPSEEKTADFINQLPNILGKAGEIVKKPLILRGANNTDIDKVLIPELAKHAPRPSIISFADEFDYELIVPEVVNNSHVLCLRSPIDINLAKELNILSSDKGLPLDKILIDPDMGGLGYGLEYGYSIIEKIKQAGFEGDKMLNMPIIAFVGEETYKAKEAKCDSFSKSWGRYDERSAMWEISAASAMICAGANIVVLWNPESVKALKGVL